jgi:transposase-like protein
MERRKFSREFKLEAARFAQATGVRLGLVAPGIWTARLEVLRAWAHGG